MSHRPLHNRITTCILPQKIPTTTSSLIKQQRTISSKNGYVWRSSEKPWGQGYRSIGIRREDKSRWERRAPLTPDAVNALVQETGARVYIQPSTKRIFPDSAYTKAGAIVSEDLSAADIILGIKEVPPSKLMPDKTYVFFSHTHKGAPKNMPMLKDILDKRIRLIDYELMKDPATHTRLVAFGKFAGNSGMVDGLHGMAHRFLGLGYNTPFMYLSMAHTYRGLPSAKLATRNMGNIIENEGTPKDFGPLVFAFTGSGNVTQGALEIFKELPHEFVPAADLAKLVNDKNPRLNKVYGTHLKVGDYTQRKRDGVFSYQEYLEHPERYHSAFADNIAPYVNSVITGAYWDERYPRMMTNAQLRELQLRQKQGLVNKGRMMSLIDIVCDTRGAFECLSHSTNIEDGFYYYDAINGAEHKDVEKDGIQIMGIDILPAELASDSSKHFSSVLYPHIKDLIHPKAESLINLPPMLAHATIADNGQLVGAHSSLESLLPQTNSGHGGSSSKRTVLLLGSGMVAGPLVQRLTQRSDVRVVVASNATSEAQALVANCSNPNQAESVPLDIADKPGLARLVSNADVVVSLVPAFLHAQVAQVCIDQGKHMVTASYVSEEMERLDGAAKKAGVLIMNEVGLDPGIDHMSAMKIIDEAKSSGKKVRSFISWCGGLPAPEASNVPLGYKFSWSPRGVLTASGNDATYWSGGKKRTVSGDVLLKHHFPTIRTPFQGFVFEGLANRDSLKYTDIYCLGNLSEMDTMFRGTLRYQGYSDLLYGLRKLGFLNLADTLPDSFANWHQYVNHVITGSISGEWKTAIHAKLESETMVPQVADALQYLLGAGEERGVPPRQLPSALDAFSTLLAGRLRYLPGERDMVAMHHEFGIEDQRTGKKEKATSTLIHYGSSGSDGDTAMATTVGLPAAMATELVLDNKIQQRGILRPTTPDVYLPILEQLHDQGIKFVERSQEVLQLEGSQKRALIPTGSGVWDA
ncbi:Saccharopine dehydrogenase-domain-containing protein [Zychaea mexicana]|uniref:Saccharopine dehydrogenase-domain-containing protein n=1 Tax=Zychaea mexicana TaxID=64656 RepID=UPI0022FEE72E|nr:Saccharopine dehydrogenase-domain-containing protein [Zychaea mexicana]KAI9496686.1 Saccharopine dehydrogenase-domain-containing protein [Zychaea mexicana]